MACLIGHGIRLLAYVFLFLGRLSRSVGDILQNFLPVFLESRELTKDIERQYLSYYADHVDRASMTSEDFRLEPWERAVVERFLPPPARLLILGCGWGREAIALQELGYHATGVDTNRPALRMARGETSSRGLNVSFLQADFHALPFQAPDFDCILLSDVMYSAIPSSRTRRRWVAHIRSLLRSGGLLIVSFVTETRSRSRLRRLSDRVVRACARLPGTNPHYEGGDAYLGGHYLHIFHQESEVRSELESAAAKIAELDWRHQYAVVQFDDVRLSITA